jgi:hypothetical protein
MMTKAKIFGTQSKSLNKILLGGFRGGGVTAIAGGFAVGKSWILINIFHHFLKRKQDPIFISLDLAIESIWKRLIMIESKIPYMEYIRSLQTGRGRIKWEQASEKLSTYNPLIQYRANSFTSIPAYLKGVSSEKPAPIIFIDGLMFPKTREAKKFYEGELRKIRSVLEGQNVSLIMSLGLGRAFAKDQKIDLAKIEAKVSSDYFNKLIVLQSENKIAADSLRKIDCLLIDLTTKKTKKTTFPIYIDDRIGIIYDKTK